MIGFATTIVADTGPYHHNLGAGGWIAMMLGTVIFWGAIVALVVWIIRGGLKSRSETPQDVLRRRLAEGSISVEEYEQRSAALDVQPTPNVERPVGPTAHGHT